MKTRLSIGGLAVALLMSALMTQAFGVEVMVDVKPGSCPSSINLNSNGVVPVGLLREWGFNPVNADPSTIMFEGASPRHWALEDVDFDGDIDMILHFKIKDTSIVPGQTSATLTGETFGGTPFTGTGSINTVPH